MCVCVCVCVCVCLQKKKCGDLDMFIHQSNENLKQQKGNYQVFPIYFQLPSIKSLPCFNYKPQFEMSLWFDLIACETGKAYPEKVTASSGWIASPNFPNTYPFDSDCAWTIIAPNGQVNTPSNFFINTLLTNQYTVKEL